MDIETSEYYDQCLKLMSIVRDELKKKGFKPIEFEKILLQEFTSCMDENIENKAQTINLTDEKQVKIYVQKIISMAPKE